MWLEQQLKKQLNRILRMGVDDTDLSVLLRTWEKTLGWVLTRAHAEHFSSWLEDHVLCQVLLLLARVQ